jgi:hypothetical protein
MRINQKRLVSSGTSILFWYDVWFGEVPFYILFSNLFAKAKSSRVITVAQVWNNDNIKIPLTRGLVYCYVGTNRRSFQYYHPCLIIFWVMIPLFGL